MIFDKIVGLFNIFCELLSDIGVQDLPHEKIKAMLVDIFSQYSWYKHDDIILC